MRAHQYKVHCPGCGRFLSEKDTGHYCGPNPMTGVRVLSTDHCTLLRKLCPREWYIWSGMKTRCSNSNRNSFRIYGGRGITVCAAWADSFERFLADMGPRPSAQHSLERIDNDGNYEPGNVRWATKSEQASNRRAPEVCVNGHELTPQNIRPRWKYRCKKCYALKRVQDTIHQRRQRALEHAFGA